MVAKAGSLRRRLTDELGTALLALVLAIVVWVNATYQADRPREDFFPETISIEVLNIPSGLTITSQASSVVNVRLNAFASSWAALSANDFRATVDLAGLPEGVHAVPIRVTCTDPTVTVLRPQPERVYIRLEALRKAALEVTVELENLEDLPLGYAVDPPDAEPRYVTIEGPASTVDRVTQVVAPLSLTGKRTSGEEVVRLRALDGEGNLVTGVRAVPNQVNVRYDIERRLNYREVAVLARTKGLPARGYYVSSVDVEPATVTLVGPPAVIANMPGVISAKGEVDITGATRMVAARLGLDLPEGVSVLTERAGETISLYEVLITVGVDPVTGGTTVELPLRTRRLQDGLIARLSVPSVDVILTGPAVVLDDLQIDLLEAYVDLSGLGVGTHQVRTVVELNIAKNPRLTELVVTSISPPFVEADVREPPTPTPVPTPLVIATPTPIPTATVTGTVAAAPSPTSFGMPFPSSTIAP